MITFKLEEEGRKVDHSIENEGLTLQELFMFWVDFASGCGYAIDKVEMAELWNGDTDREIAEALDAHLETETKLAKAIEALAGVKSFTDDFRGEGEALAPRLAKAVETLGELKEFSEKTIKVF